MAGKGKKDKLKQDKHHKHQKHQKESHEKKLKDEELGKLQGGHAAQHIHLSDFMPG